MATQGVSVLTRQNYSERPGANIEHPAIDFQDIRYYAAPKSAKDGPQSIEDVDPEVLEAFSKLGIPLEEQARLAGRSCRCGAG